MHKKCRLLTGWIPVLLLLVSCTNESGRERDLLNDQFPEAKAELREAVEAIAEHAMTANIKGLQEAHIDSDKFTKFGPRNFDRQNVTSTNESEAAFFCSVSNMNYQIKELKIDVFGDVGVVTYYPHVTFVKEGEEKEVSGRQTLVFLKTGSGWKIVHEHGTIKK